MIHFSSLAWFYLKQGFQLCARVKTEPNKGQGSYCILMVFHLVLSRKRFGHGMRFVIKENL